MRNIPILRGQHGKRLLAEVSYMTVRKTTIGGNHIPRFTLKLHIIGLASEVPDNLLVLLWQGRKEPTP